VDINCLRQGGKVDWRQIAGPMSRWNKIDQAKGLPTITEIPGATNIKLVGRK
jgi:hypothetical protein